MSGSGTVVTVRREGGSGEQVAWLRMQMLEAFGEDQGDTEVLLAALQQVNAELGGLGGMAHFGARGTGLRLIVSTGLPRAFTRYWGVSPNVVRQPRPGRSETAGSCGCPPLRSRSGRKRCRYLLHLSLSWRGPVSLRWRCPDGKVSQGAVSVLTPPEEPGAEQRAFLDEVARWLSRRLRLDVSKPEKLPPAIQEVPERLRYALHAAAVMPWELDLRTGRFPSTRGSPKSTASIWAGCSRSKAGMSSSIRMTRPMCGMRRTRRSLAAPCTTRNSGHAEMTGHGRGCGPAGLAFLTTRVSRTG